MIGRAASRRLRSMLLASCVVVAVAANAFAASADRALLERLQKLEDEQARLQKELDAKDARIDALQADLEAAKGKARAWVAEQETAPQGDGMPPVPLPDKERGALATTDPKKKEPSAVGRAISGVLGTYEQGRGFGLARTEWGEVNFGIYTYLRYLNQKGVDDTYTNGLGQKVQLDQREDLQLNKVKIEFRGWLIDPRFRYVLYSWTNQAVQGLGAQVVLGGNLNWVFGPWLTVGGGILSLPTTRSTQGNFPYWLTVDHRTITDEFFRGSYSQGFFGYGQTGPVGYYAMLANNLSTLGVDANQMDADFTTFSGALWWMPTTGEFGPRSGFGDYEHHEDLATRLGVHFSFSPEDKQSQPGTDDIDNTQIRLSNGTIVFTEGALAPGVSVESVKYYMVDLDAGLKWKGFALEGEWYLRWLQDFRADGHLPTHELFDHGFQLLASHMVLPKTVQVYTMGAYLFGEYGDSWETTAGVNWWIFRRREVRVNLEYLYVDQSPIGYTAVPQQVGATGSVFTANVEMSF